MNDIIKQALLEQQKHLNSMDFHYQSKVVDAMRAADAVVHAKEMFANNRGKCQTIESEMIKLGMVPKKDFWPILANDEPLPAEEPHPVH